MYVGLLYPPPPPTTTTQLSEQMTYPKLLKVNIPPQRAIISSVWGMEAITGETLIFNG